MGEFKLHWPNWVGVVVEDLEAQRRFYRDVLGLTEAGAGDGWVWFDMGERRLFELLAKDPNKPQYDSVRYQTGFRVEDIRASADELAARGVERITDIEGGPDAGQHWCYFRADAGLQLDRTKSRPGAGEAGLPRGTPCRPGAMLTLGCNWIGQSRGRAEPVRRCDAGPCTANWLTGN